MGEQEPEEPEDKIGPETDALLCLEQMDAEAAVAYEVAAASMGDEEIAQMLRNFAKDHRQHVSDIRRLLAELGGELSLASADPETATFAMMAEALSELGPSASLRAMVASEQFTNSVYETALELITQPAARSVLERNFGDELRHLKTLLRLLGRSECGEQRQSA